jgi:hypothetical protein
VAILWPGGTAVYDVGAGGNSLVDSFEVGGVTGLPAWSSEGDKIAFNMHVGQTTSSYYGEISVYEVAGGSEVAALVGTDPTWDPSGTDDLIADLHPDGTVTSPGLELLFPEDAGGLTFDFATEPVQPQFIYDDVLFLAGGNIVSDPLVVADGGAPADAGTNGATAFTISPFGDGVYYLAPGSTQCDLSVIGFSEFNYAFSPPANGVVTGVGCSASFALTPNDQDYLALADGVNIFVQATNTDPAAESSLTPYLTASGTVTQVAFTPDQTYLVYSTLTPNSSSPGQGTITLTFVPFTEGSPFSAAGELRLTEVGQTFALSPVLP